VFSAVGGSFGRWEPDHRGRLLPLVEHTELPRPLAEHRLVDDPVAPLKLSLRGPTIAIAVERGTAARSKLRTAVRLADLGLGLVAEHIPAALQSRAC
jgi:hypothetical protein